MRSSFKPTVEKYRVVHPVGGAGDRTNGCFVIPLESGTINCIVSDGEGWDHVSVSIMPERNPTWEEMCLVKKMFFHPNEWVLQYHPAEKDYLDYGRSVLHLWRPQNGGIPKPPKVMV